MVVYICQRYSLNSSHPLLPPLCPQVPSLCLRLYSRPANKCYEILKSKRKEKEEEKEEEEGAVILVVPLKLNLVHTL